MKAARALFLVCLAGGAGCTESPREIEPDAGARVDAGAIDAGWELDAGTTLDAGDVRCLPTAVDPSLPEPDLRDEPCVTPELWPSSLESSRFPFVVHHRPGEEALACEVRDLIETAWAVEVEQLGFSPPLPDDGSCGPDARFDVYIWTGIEESYVAAWDENPATAWNDQLSYMVVDPLGPYGGDLLDATLAHELNHALQASDDWWEAPIVFEMTSTFMEEVVFDDDDSWQELLVDFQSRPDWSLDRNDDYETWYMYAAALYLEFLRAYAFDGDASFVADMWLRSRNPPGAENDPSLNEPDFADALDTLLMDAAGITYVESAAVFARWRWYTGSRDDGRHFPEGAQYPEDALVPAAASVTVDAGRVEITPAPMILGSVYVDVTGASAFELTLDGAPSVEWVVQAVPGLSGASDGEIVDVSAGPARVELTPQGTRTLILTALPLGPYDPDTRTDARYAAAIELAPAP